MHTNTQKKRTHAHSRQATINVGTIGHVAHGKSTVVKALSGVMVSCPSSMCVCVFACV